ncbi:MAG: CapA family protein [Myxococcaceae bacterium]|nr:CapA family protein [Myxococcaceae bacterium]
MASLVGLLVGCAAQPTTRPPPRAVLWFGGDVHLGQRGASSLDGLALDGPLVINLEGPIGTAPGPSSAERLINPPDTASTLARARVLAAGVDNNHSLDDGPEGLERTREALFAQKVVPLGLSVLTVSGVPVTLLQVDLSKGAPKDLEARLTWAADAPGVAIVLFHVLAPPLYTPDPPLKSAVALAAEVGIDAVLVHGSHALGAVERKGKTLVAWGLGNVAFDCECTAEDEGLLVRLEVSGSRVEEATVVPIRAGLQGAAARRATPAEASLDLDLLESLGSKPLDRTATHARF